MNATMPPLRDEHQELLPHVDQLRQAADRVGYAPIATMRRAVDEAHAFLIDHLLPHAQAEDAALYPLVEQVLAAPGATATMRRDHVEVGRLSQELGALRARLAQSDPDDDLARALRRVLYGLHALVTVHFAKEEEVYLPLLDERLAPAQARALYAAMEAAAQRARRQAMAATP